MFTKGIKRVKGTKGKGKGKAAFPIRQSWRIQKGKCRTDERKKGKEMPNEREGVREKMTEKRKNICIYQKKIVPLHSQRFCAEKTILQNRNNTIKIIQSNKTQTNQIYVKRKQSNFNRQRGRRS